MSKLRYYLPAFGAEQHTHIMGKIQARINQFGRILTGALRTTRTAIISAASHLLPAHLMVKQTASTILARALGAQDEILYRTYSRWDGEHSRATPLGIYYELEEEL